MSGNRSKSAFFEGGWVTLSADFRVKGASPTNHCWCQKTRVIASDGQTDGRTDGQNSDSNTVRCITCSRTVKTKNSLFEPLFWALRGNVRTPSMARWKARGDFIFVVIELFCYLLRLRRYERKSVEVGVFRRGGSL